MLKIKPIPSLAPALLARKGSASPAMRPQVQPLQLFHTGHPEELDDLGWNDMGYEGDAPAEAPPARPSGAEGRCPAEPAHRLEPIRRRRIAVSLKIDAHRHFQLRLASLLTNRSAQQLVSQSLDRLLDELPGLSTVLQRLVRK